MQSATHQVLQRLVVVQRLALQRLLPVRLLLLCGAHEVGVRTPAARCPLSRQCSSPLSLGQGLLVEKGGCLSPSQTLVIAALSRTARRADGQLANAKSQLLANMPAAITASGTATVHHGSSAGWQHTCTLLVALQVVRPVWPREVAFDLGHALSAVPPCQRCTGSTRDQ